MASGRAASWLLASQRLCKRGEAADGLGQGRELVVGEPEALQLGEAADGLGQGRELVAVERELLQAGRGRRWPRAGPRAGCWRERALQAGEAADGVGQGRELVMPQIQEDELILRFNQLGWKGMESVSFRFFFTASQIN